MKSDFLREIIDTWIQSIFLPSKDHTERAQGVFNPVASFEQKTGQVNRFTRLK